MSTSNNSNSNSSNPSKMREYIRQLLNTTPKAVERGVVALYKRQTEDEKRIGDTKHPNGRGFNVADASLGTYYAKWVMGGNKLEGQHLAIVRTMLRKYVGQLALVAGEKEQAKKEWEAREQAKFN